MARIISKRPIIGIVQGLIFGALGFLILGMDRLPAATPGAARVLFQVLGAFLLFVAGLSFLTALFAMIRLLSPRTKR